MIKVKVNNEYKDVVKIFCGGNLQKEIVKVWSREAQEYVYESSVEYTGSLPITITANGDALLDYRIYGTDGGVGVATENLWDEDYTNIGVTIRYKAIYVGSGDFTLSTNTPLYGEAIAMLFLLAGNVSSGASGRNKVYKDNPQTVTSIDGYVTVAYRVTSGIDPRDYSTILNLGSTALPYIPYGYKLPMTVSSEVTENLFDISKVESGTDAYGGSIAVSNNAIVVTTSEISSNVISPGNKTLQDFTENLVVGETYTIFANTTGSTNIFLYGANVVVSFGNAFTLTSEMLTSVVCWYALGRNSTATITNFMLVSGSTRPDHYIPHRYTSNYDLFIGENQLDAGEYVSYGEQKIYRDVDGTLTPTDPPVPLPEIPTIDGTTIIDYDGDPKPSQMYVKYRR